jgi:hypothetical protein
VWQLHSAEGSDLGKSESRVYLIDGIDGQRLSFNVLLISAMALITHCFGIALFMPLPCNWCDHRRYVLFTLASFVWNVDAVAT